MGFYSTEERAIESRVLELLNSRLPEDTRSDVTIIGLNVMTGTMTSAQANKELDAIEAVLEAIGIEINRF